MTRLLLAMALVACSREPPKVALGLDAGAKANALAPSTSKRCLPVVAADCGCVYACGVGTETSPGVWSVDHPSWAPNAIKAKIAPWCASGDCTDAFHGEIVCSGICAPKPADHGCHFEGDRCVSSAQTPMNLHPAPDAERDAAIKARFGQECRLERTCGPLWGVDCDAAADGPYYYVRVKPTALEVITTCGGACMGGRCTNCPPKNEGWTCPTY